MPPSARAKIEDLHRRIRPWLVEIAASPLVKGSARSLRVVDGPAAGAPHLDELLARMHPGEKWIASLGPGEEPAIGSRWVGATVIVEESASFPRPDPAAGRFFLSLIHRPRAFGEVFVSPVAFYWVGSEGKFLRFEHRFVQSLGDHPIEEIPQELFEKYVLNALNYYQEHALRPDPRR